MSGNLDELFYREPYTKEFEAKVLECTEGKKGYEVVLEDTAFYPEGGGQPSDIGTLDQANVSFVKRAGDKIIHYTDQPFEVGKTVKGKINWENRFDNMQNHTAEHMFSGLVHKKLGFNNVGFHMDPKDITVDFDGEIPEDVLAQVERETNEAIQKGIDLEISFPSSEELSKLDYRSKKELSGKVRIVRVPGCDMCACCGTHVANTAEIGFLKVLEASKHRGGTRVRFAAGTRALNDYTTKLEQAQKVSELLSAKIDEIAKAVEQNLEDQKKKQHEYADRSLKYFTLLLKTVDTQTNPVIVHEDGLSSYELKRLATLAAETLPDKFVAVLTECADKSGFNYVLAFKGASLAEKSKNLNKKLNGRGGGRDGMVQGTYRSDLNTVVAAVKEEAAN